MCRTWIGISSTFWKNLQLPCSTYIKNMPIQAYYHFDNLLPLLCYRNFRHIFHLESLSVCVLEIFTATPEFRWGTLWLAIWSCQKTGHFEQKALIMLSPTSRVLRGGPHSYWHRCGRFFISGNRLTGSFRKHCSFLIFKSPIVMLFRLNFAAINIKSPVTLGFVESQSRQTDMSIL